MSDAALTRPAETVNPERLIEILSGSGWEAVGSRERRYVRLRRSDEFGATGPSVVVPLNRAAGDFGELMAAAIESIRRLSEDVWLRSIEPLLGLALVDKLCFRKETSAPRGLIAWGDGVELIDSARRTLIAGAKAYRGPSRNFSNRFGPFAGRYLDQVFMGQSGTGSYVVTALALTEARVPIRNTAEDTLGLEGVDFARGRDVTASVVRALEATTEALGHFKSSGSMSGFDDQVSSGVSYELVTALHDVASGADESDIMIELAHTDDMSITDPVAEVHQFVFSGSDATVLEQASAQLLVSTEPERLRVEGRVHLLERRVAGGPGVVGIDEGNYRYRVRLNSGEEYHEAVLAHDENRFIMVEGDLSQKGTHRWLNNAQLLSRPSRAPSDPPYEDQAQRGFGFPELGG